MSVQGKPAVAISLVVHGVAVIAFAQWFSRERSHPVRAPSLRVATATPPVEPTPIAVEIIELQLPSEGGRGGGLDHAGEAAASRSAAITTGGSVSGTSEPGPSGGGPNRWLTMRGADLRLDHDFLDQVASGGKPLERPGTSGKLAPNGGGTAVTRDRVTTMTVHRDGTVNFEDEPDIDIHFDINLPTPESIKRDLRKTGKSLAKWYVDPYAKARVGPIQEVPRYLSATPGACDGYFDACSMELRQRTDSDDPLEPSSGGRVGHGKLDITDMLMRKFVGDPYASRKLKLLDTTFEERAAMGAQHKAEDRARSAELMQRNLVALWRTTTDPVERRAALFTLWDECGEGEGPDGDAGQRARGMVIGWIRAKLPAGSPDAFTPAEIAALQAHRTSRQPFVPYE